MWSEVALPFAIDRIACWGGGVGAGVGVVGVGAEDAGDESTAEPLGAPVGDDVVGVDVAGPLGVAVAPGDAALLDGADDAFGVEAYAGWTTPPVRPGSRTFACQGVPGMNVHAARSNMPSTAFAMRRLSDVMPEPPERRARAERCYCSRRAAGAVRRRY